MIMRRVLHGGLLAAAFVEAAASLCFGQASFQTPQGNVNVQGAPIMCPTQSGNYVPCGAALPVPVVVLPAGNPLPVAPSIYPPNSIPITGNATGTTGAVVGTLAARPAATTYICGFNVSAIGGTAAVGPITIAGLVGSSMVYQLAYRSTSQDNRTSREAACQP
jgi:hypothetical protein